MSELTRLDVDASFSTVEQLRDLLAFLPGKAKVEIDSLPNGMKSDGMVLMTALDYGELRPELVLPAYQHRITSACICEACGIDVVSSVCTDNEPGLIFNSAGGILKSPREPFLSIKI